MGGQRRVRKTRLVSLSHLTKTTSSQLKCLHLSFVYREKWRKNGTRGKHDLLSESKVIETTRTVCDLTDCKDISVKSCRCSLCSYIWSCVWSGKHPHHKGIAPEFTHNWTKALKTAEGVSENIGPAIHWPFPSPATPECRASFSSLAHPGRCTA